MYVDLSDVGFSRILFIRGAWEYFEGRLMAGLVRKGDIVLDLGANIGYHTLMLSDAVGSEGRVHAFEPDPWNYELLLRNIALNGCRNVTAVQKAVSDVTGRCRLYVSPNDFGDHRIHETSEKRKAVMVETVRLDDYVRDGDRIALVKMDIQGAEFAALKGMTSVVRKGSPIVLAEFEPGALRDSGVEPAECLKLMESMGFELWDIDGSNGAVRPVTPMELLKRYDIPNRPKDHANLLLVPSVRRSRLLQVYGRERKRQSSSDSG